MNRKLVGVVAVGATALWSFDPYSIVLTTVLAILPFVTASLPVFVGALAGTMFAAFSNGRGPPARGEPDSTTTATATE